MLFLLSIFIREEFGAIMLKSITEGGVTLTSYGLEVNFLTQTGDINMIAVTLFFLGGIIGFVLMAMIFRNINLIMKTINGKNKHTTSTSPFQECVIRMVKEIGIFSIAIPVVGFLISVITFAVSMISGLGGAEMARSEGYNEGQVPLQTLRADVDYAVAEAHTTYGKLGIKVWIYKGEVFGLQPKAFEERKPQRPRQPRRENKDSKGGK